jgi:type I restriction enzyme M protein
MLISCAVELKNQGKEFRSLKLYGQEMNYTTGSIAKMNLFLHGVEDGRIAHGDTLSEPKFLDESGKLKTFNVVLANPPYSIKTLDRTLFAADPFGRNIWGVPPQGRADYAFFQHVAKSMDSNNGRAAILFPHGVLFRQEERELREKLVNSGMLEAVIGLGAGLFYNSPMEAVVIILRNGRPVIQSTSTLFMNGVDLVTRERAVSYLSDSHQGEILSVYRNYKNVVGLASVRLTKEIEANDFSLAIPLYVDKLSDSSLNDKPSLSKVFETWVSSSKQSESALKSLLTEIVSKEAS